MERKRGTWFGANGNKIDNVSVSVKIAGTSTDAPLWSDNGITTKANPFTNDSDGSWEFYTKNSFIDIIPTKTGVTFTADNYANILCWDPVDAANVPQFRCDFYSLFTSTNEIISDGHHWVKAGGTTSVTGDTTYRNGWIDVIESGGVAGALTLVNTGSTLQLLFVPTAADLIILEGRIEKVGDAVAGTRRCGLGSAAMSAGDPANGIYLRQIDTNNAFFVTRSSSTESTQDTGFTLNNPRRFRITILTGNVRGYIENDSGVLVATTAITTNIPTAIMGLSAGGGATASAGGCRLDYLNVIPYVRV